MYAQNREIVKTILTENPDLFLTLSGKKLSMMLSLTEGDFGRMIESFFLI